MILSRVKAAPVVLNADVKNGLGIGITRLDWIALHFLCRAGRDAQNNFGSAIVFADIVERLLDSQEQVISQPSRNWTVGQPGRDIETAFDRCPLEKVVGEVAKIVG